MKATRASRVLTRVVLAFALLLGGVAPASAHTRSTSSSSFEIQSGERASARVLVRAPISDLQAAIAGTRSSDELVLSPPDTASLDAYLVAHYALLADGVPCPTQSPAQPLSGGDATHVARAWRVLCPPARTLALRADGFFEVLPAHLHLARSRLDAAPANEHVVVLENRRFPIVLGEATAGTGGPPSREAPGSSLGDFVRLGALHIVTGVDHLVFLLGLVLGAARIGQLAMIVTGFTIAHSLTLALGVLGVLRPAPMAIEALIGLSIAIVALENFAATTTRSTRRGILAALALVLAAGLAGSIAGRVAIAPPTFGGIALFCISWFTLVLRSGDAPGLRWVVAFAFGLIHGFGFAGALLEAEIPSERLAGALFGFNVGVEAGQLGLVAATWPFLALSRRLVSPANLVQLGSTPVLAAGLYWLLSRALA